MIFVLTLIVVAVFPVVWIGVGRIIPYLEARAILDRPNERSSHHTVTPRGGGLVVIVALLSAWMLIAVITGDVLPILVWVVAAGLLAAVSWLDDKDHVNTGLRLILHMAAAAVGLWALGDDPVFQGLLPFWLDRLAALLLWVWFVNLFNFMDGIDGITGGETASIGLGIALVSLVSSLNVSALYLGLSAVAAALAFLKWNWHPAKVFLGDVGSVSLGYLLGGMLLWTATQGAWAAALILPLYYLADATWTLVHRAIKGEKIWQAHRQHFYQRALGSELGHAAVAGRIVLVNLGLIALALLAAAGHEWSSLLFAVGLTAALMAHFERAARKSKDPL